MKHANLLSLIMLLFLGTAGTQALATTLYTPNTVRDISANKAYCLGATATNIRFRYYTCHIGTSTAAGTSLNVAWYANTTNSTTGGTLVSSSVVTCAKALSGSITYLPPTGSTGITYYYCVLTWTGTGTCNTAGSLTSGTTMITISETPDAIVGNDIVCIGTPTTYYNSASGGTWSRSNTRVTIDANTGYANGVSAGAVRITYRVACGTRVTKTVTVQAVPTVNVITGGTSKICQGATATLNCSPSGGTWASGNTAVATIGTNRVVTGISPGTATITYTRTNGCGTASTTKVVTVTAAPAAISGLSSTCPTYAITYSNSVPYGVWSSSNTSKATINSSTGEITAIASGTARITYNTGCTPVATKVLTINVGPSAISGINLICGSGTTTLSNSTPGGTWTTSDASVATVSSGGVVTAVSLGTAGISYSVGAPCDVVSVVTVTSTPSAISGTFELCTGTTTTLTNTANFGTWTSSDPSVATIDASGVVTAVAQGTTTISYNTGCGTPATQVVTVYTQPDVITGTAEACVGASTTLANTVGGGVWTSENTSLATINSSTGVATGVSDGAVNITYTNGVCYSSVELTLDPLADPGTITGGSSVCEGDGLDLVSDGDAGGVWTSSSTANATVNSTGTVTGVAAGTTNISYSVTNGCGTVRAIQAVVINADPVVSAITGTASLCQAGTTTLSDAASGGVWSSSNSSVATVGTNGVVSGIAGGNATISYSVTNACGTINATQVTTVNPLPAVAAIGGTAVVCPSATTSLSDATSGGVWSSSNTSVATVNASGVVTGVAAGNATISYGVTNSCGTTYVTKVATVNALPSAGSITGTAVVCASATTALNDAAAGGVWSSSNTSVATVNSSGVVTGVAAGNATISYTVTNSCGTANATAVATVNPLPLAGSITGTASVCESATTSLNDAASGGAWSSSNTSVATVNSSGVVTGVAAGNATISYTVTNSCGTANATAATTVNPLPSAGTITGTASVCESATTSLSDAASGGVWSSSNTSVATVNTSGVITGVAAGNATISYTVTNGCGTATATAAATVNPLPSAGSITGTASVCESATTSLSDAAAGGAWSSSNTSVATVNTSGVVTGVAAGNATISYTVTNGCGTANATATTTVNPLPSAGSITGTASVCESATTALNDVAAGGAWSSSNTAVATVNTSGVVTGVAAGNATISYTVTNSCGTANATAAATVNPLPSAGSITGTASVCESATTALNDAAAGGAWSSSNTSVATVGTDGVVTGVAAGNATISYTVTNSCGTANATVEATVNAAPSAGTITGTAIVCGSSSTTLSNATPGGAWSSSNTSVATVGTDGVVNGVSTGNSTISYTVSTACGSSSATQVVTVGVVPASITGTAAICMGGTSALSIADASGTWSSSNPSQATVNPTTGVVTSVSLGTSTITYTSATGCYFSTLEVTVSTTVPGISGSSHVCTGQTTTLGNATSGGVWSSSNPAIASIDPSTGVVTGVSAGSVIISYTLAGGCFAPITFFVYANPTPITGISSFCTESYTVLYSTIGGSGTWSSSNPAVASANLTSGMITGLTAGTSTITYLVAASGCYVTNDVTVNLTPASITGSTAICTGLTQTYSSATSGGTWTSFQPSVATIDANTGLATAITAGNTVMSYTLANGCYRTYAATVNPLPETITASTFNICLGVGTTLSSATTGGTWTSGNTSIATITPSTGVVTSMGLGTATISYTNAFGCSATTPLTVYSGLASITGNSIVCKNYTTTLADATSGGTWSTSNTSIASINSVTGVLTGMNGGTANVTYRLGSGCLALKAMSVAAITGNLSLCAGTTSVLTHLVPGGVWSCNNTSKATIDATTGVVSAIAVGSAVITYNMGSGVYNTATIVISSLPAAISGASAICAETNSLYTGTVGGSATWSSSDVTVGTVNTTSGMVTGIAEGTTTLTYKVPTSGCYTTRTIAVNPAPAVICGPSTICVGTAVTFTSATSGGTWTSTPTSVATVGSTTGVVTATTAGGMTLSYTLTTGCRKTKAITVNTLPGAITGSTTVAQGGSTLLNSSTTGGTWVSSNTTVAAPATTSSLTGASSSGLINGISAGASTITYTGTNGCYRTANLSVTAPKPGAPITTTTENEVEFKLYPNPTNGTFTVETPVNGVFAIYSFDGKAVNEIAISDKTTTVSLPNTLAAGVYICQFRMEDGTSKTAKLVYQP